MAVNEELNTRAADISSRLFKARKLAGITQLQAAEKLDVTQSCLSQLEHNQRKWSCALAAKAVKIYGTTYEAVFGELENSRSSESEPDDLYLPCHLLQMLADAPQSKELSSSVKAYIYIGIYRLLRTLYQCNGRNTEAIFSLDKKAADSFADKFLLNETDNIRALVTYSRRINSSAIELPVEYSAELREVIAVCEKYISSMLPDGHAPAP